MTRQIIRLLTLIFAAAVARGARATPTEVETRRRSPFHGRRWRWRKAVVSAADLVRVAASNPIE